MTPDLPENKNQPNPEPLKFVSDEDAEKLTTLLFKQFNRKTPKTKKERELYFYSPTSISAWVPAGVPTGSNQHLYQFLMGKFHRKLYDTKRRPDGNVEREEKVNRSVKRVEIDRMGNAKVIDSDADFFIDSEKFAEEFERDNV